LTECSIDRIHALALQPDGLLVVGGFCHLSDSNSDRFVVARYQSDGSGLDETFSGDGKEITDYGPDTHSQILGMTIRPSDGAIVVAGYARRGSAAYLFALARYDANGNLDQNFGLSGLQTFDLSTASDIAYAVTLQPDGQIVAVGSAGMGYAIIRCDTNGQNLDGNFGTGGKVVASIPSRMSWLRSVTLQPDGKIVAAGATSSSEFHFLVVRYDSAGNPDNSFGNGTIPGVVETTFTGGSGEARGVSVWNGTVIAGGYAVDTDNDTGENQYRFVLVRYKGNDGTPDTIFGPEGRRFIGTVGQNLVGRSLVVQSDGKILLAGSSHDGIRHRFTVARIWDRDASDLEITSFTSDRDRVVKGADLVYTVSYKNRTGDLARGVVITSRFSLAVELVAGDHGCSSQSAADGGVTVTCPRPDVPVADPDHQLSFAVKPSVAGTLAASVQISSGGHDMTPGHGTGSLSVTIDEAAIDDDDEGDVDEGDVDDPPADDGDQTPEPLPPEFRERRLFEISDPAVIGEPAGGGGCSFVPGSDSGPQDILWILLGSSPLFLLGLKEIFCLFDRNFGCEIVEIL
ncbi:MAG: hypothetical protein HY542_03975, partial [Deltaproteobacteria bacterium]|nr:hypothetical protein [Deltaproteobacteria bacterium]